MREKHKPLLMALVTFMLILNVVVFLAGRRRLDSTVGPTGVVEGTATIPDGTYLWVLDRRKVMNRWWPQGRGPARIEDGKWAVRVAPGHERDRGRELYFAAVVVDAGFHANLERWVVEAPARGYGSRRFPETVPGCELAMVAVRRAR